MFYPNCSVNQSHSPSGVRVPSVASRWQIYTTVIQFLPMQRPFPQRCIRYITDAFSLGGSNPFHRTPLAKLPLIHTMRAIFPKRCIRYTTNTGVRIPSLEPRWWTIEDLYLCARPTARGAVRLTCGCPYAKIIVSIFGG
jgi:hypothetical protein